MKKFTDKEYQRLKKRYPKPFFGSDPLFFYKVKAINEKIYDLESVFHFFKMKENQSESIIQPMYKKKRKPKIKKIIIISLVALIIGIVFWKYILALIITGIVLLIGIFITIISTESGYSDSYGNVSDNFD